MPGSDVMDDLDDFLLATLCFSQRTAFQSHTGCVCGKHHQTYWKSSPDGPPACLPKLGLLDPNSAYSFDKEEFDRLYEWGPAIHRGSRAVVYEGVRRADQLPIAIKKIEKCQVAESGRLGWRSLPMEVVSLLMLRGVPGVTQLLDAHEAEHVFLLVLERPAPCEDLLDHVTRCGPLSEQRARNCFRQLLQTVRAVHERGLMHRDIKDENVLLRLQDDSVYLTDFGSAALKQDVPYCEYEGTSLYAPPEWHTRSMYRGEAGAVWTLGILLHVMLCGKPPFDSVDRKLMGIARGEIGAGAELSEGAEHVILRCLSWVHTNRPSLEELAEHPWVTHDPSSEQPPPRPCPNELEEFVRGADGKSFMIYVRPTCPSCSSSAASSLDLANHNSDSASLSSSTNRNSHTCCFATANHSATSQEAASQTSHSLPNQNEFRSRPIPTIRTEFCDDATLNSSSAMGCAGIEDAEEACEDSDSKDALSLSAPEASFSEQFSHIKRNHCLVPSNM